MGWSFWLCAGKNKVWLLRFMAQNDRRLPPIARQTILKIALWEEAPFSRIGVLRETTRPNFQLEGEAPRPRHLHNSLFGVAPQKGLMDEQPTIVTPSSAPLQHHRQRLPAHKPESRVGTERFTLVDKDAIRLVIH